MTEREALLRDMEAALRAYYEGPCPICNGDCASANPPVYNCPTRDAADVLRRYKSLPLLAEPSGWHTMDSAPKDGTFIIADCGDRIRIIQWYDDFAYENGEPVGAWTDHAVEYFGYETCQEYNPVSWLPLDALPPPPARAE